MTNKVILMRHGRSTGNEDKNMYSLPDSAVCLTMLGTKQAVNAGNQLRGLLESGYFNWHWGDVHAFASSYSRAQQTGRIVLDVMGMKQIKPIESRGINERRYGKLVIDESETWNQDNNPRWRPGKEGESMVECRERFAFWFQHHAEYLLSDADVILFMHGEVLKAATAHLLDLSNEEMMQVECPNGVPYIYERDREYGRYKQADIRFEKYDNSVDEVVR